MIPIKGYATFDTLKHCWIGSAFKIEWFENTPFYKNDKIDKLAYKLKSEISDEIVEKIINHLN